ncbi:MULTISPECIES: TetR/AcrR family transcriptional regulator [Actinomadura]|uniref:TetR/AcrR family transcriptional regulator n=1 Tax=Actinomadura geliboluensis TaxID=882440 RepID=A0A5S4GUK4_9ACTN|nr:TetR/AcrR family transcriptional regulator [Actinomadura geliboluensis]TMR30110.1 TetR/AcrR family transcriptional regulator [Actinomadura geliboluensis]
MADRHRPDRRAAIMRTAARLFADRPYDVLSMDEIAAAAGVAKGLIYYYFGSKRGLFLAVIEDAAGHLGELAAEFGDLSPVERLTRSLDGFLCWAESHRAAFQTITSGGVGVDAEVAALHHRVRGDLLAALSHGLTGRAIPSPALRIALEGWLSFVEGAATSWLAEQDMERDDVRDLAVRVLGGVLKAVEAPARPPGPGEH